MRGVAELCARDEDLAAVVSRHRLPPLWRRRPGFSTLVRIILEQQVSLASAAAAYHRLQAGLGRVTARRMAEQSPQLLRQYGLTRQKAGYCYDLAWLVDTGQLDLRSVGRATDMNARRALLKVRGIGPWTADIYLLMALGRPDVWPDGDLALVQAAYEVKRLRRPPSRDRLRRLAAAWKPWRSVAARILWHHYLSTRRNGRKTT